MAEEEKKETDGRGGTDFTTVLNFIPSAYYDLIARICPGMAFWITILYKQEVHSLDGAIYSHFSTMSGTMLFVLIILSYVSGIVLTGFSVLWDLISIFLLSIFSPMRRALDLETTAAANFFIRFVERWKIVSLRVDCVHKEDDRAGRILVKAMAEVTLCQNLLSGLIVLAGIGFYSGGEKFYPPGEYCLYYGLIGGALFFSMLFRQSMFLGRVFDLYTLHASTKPRSIRKMIRARKTTRL